MIAPYELAKLRQTLAAADASLKTAFVDAFEVVREPLARIHADLERAALEFAAAREASR